MSPARADWATGRRSCSRDASVGRVRWRPWTNRATASSRTSSAARRRRTLRRNTDAKTGSLALVRQILDRILDGPAASMCHYREPREGMALVEDFRGDILDSVAAAQLLVFS